MQILSVARSIGPPKDLVPVFLSGLISPLLLFFVVSIPAPLAFSLFLKCTKIAVLAFPLALSSFVPSSYLGWLLSSDLSPCVTTLEKLSQNTPSAPVPVLHPWSLSHHWLFLIPRITVRSWFVCLFTPFLFIQSYCLKHKVLENRNITVLGLLL